MQKNILFYFLIVALLLPSCAATNQAKVDVTYDPGYKKGSIQIGRAAIMPSRKPMNIPDKEKWIEYNAKELGRLLKERGFEVIEQSISEKAYKASGLPIEDTGNSAEKFAHAAQELKADILVVPYYDMKAETANTWFGNEFTFNTMVSLQIYSSRDNRFIFRSDSVDKSGYTQLSQTTALLSIFTAVAIPTINLAAGSQNQSTANTISGTVQMLSGVIATGALGVDWYYSVYPKELWWKQAFDKTLVSSIEPFLEPYPKIKVSEETSNIFLKSKV